MRLFLLPWKLVDAWGYLAQREIHTHVVCDSCINWVQFVGSRIGVCIFWTERDTNVECTLYEQSFSIDIGKMIHKV